MTEPGCTGEWGCTCPVCKDRKHPLDLMARATQEQLRSLEHLSAEAGSCHIQPPAGCLICGRPARPYMNARLCDIHKSLAYSPVYPGKSEG